MVKKFQVPGSKFQVSGATLALLVPAVLAGAAFMRNRGSTALRPLEPRLTDSGRPSLEPMITAIDGTNWLVAGGPAWQAVERFDVILAELELKARQHKLKGVRVIVPKAPRKSLFNRIGALLKARNYVEEPADEGGIYKLKLTTGSRKTLDLTTDRPLPLREARKLARWWQQNGFSADIYRVNRGRRKPYYGVRVSRIREGSRGLRYDNTFLVRRPRASDVISPNEVMVLYDSDGKPKKIWRGNDSALRETFTWIEKTLDLVQREGNPQPGDFLQLGDGQIYRFEGLEHAWSDEYLLHVGNQGAWIGTTLVGQRLRVAELMSPEERLRRNSKVTIKDGHWVSALGKRPRGWR